VPVIKSTSLSSSESVFKEDGIKSSQEPIEVPASRELGNWLTAYGQYTSESESPSDYHLWTGISILASAVRRNVYLNQGIYILYPNLYVILCGPPGIAKSTTIRLGRQILMGVDDINMGPDSVTAEELIRIMARSGNKEKHSAVTIHSSELSSLIDPSGIKMIQFLTDIFDAQPGAWKRSTKGSGRNVIHNPVLNILAGTTPTWIAEGLPSTVIGHGFTSRVVFVYGDRPRHYAPFPSEPPPELVRALTADVAYISRLEGEFSWGEGSKDCYREMYIDISDSRPKDYRIEGFHARKKIHLLKVAMLLNMAESDDMILEVRDLETSKTLLDNVEQRMHQTFSAVGKYEHASDLERVYNRIVEEKGMTAQEVHEEFYAIGDVQELAKILMMLTAMGRIRRERKGDVTSYLPDS